LRATIDRYLIIKGKDYTAVWCEDLMDINKSYLEKLSETKKRDLQLLINDDMIAEPIRSSRLPDGVKDYNASENLLSFVGTKSMQIFDLN